MVRIVLKLACLLMMGGYAQDPAAPPAFSFKVAHAHEIKPVRHTFPLEGIHSGYHQLELTLTVSPTGKVLEATAVGDEESLVHFSQIKPEILTWTFTPIEVNQQPVTARLEEYVNLVPPERLPATHVPPPTLRPDSKITITLDRGLCFGSCPAYTVTITPSEVVFDGQSYVSAKGKQTAAVEPSDVRRLAAKFIAADFYSMDDAYHASVTDNPYYRLSISVDGHRKSVEDYVGFEVGMPAVISELEDDVDTLAHSEKWIKGPPAPATQP